MNIAILSTRLSGTDGVSLETEKWARVFERLGHQVKYCAGELGGYAGAGELLPLMHFEHTAIAELNREAFGRAGRSNRDRLKSRIRSLADQISGPLRAFLIGNKIDLVLVENALSIPMNLPLGVSLAQVIGELALPTIGHHHDYFWERERFQSSPILELVDATFPPDLPTIRHVSINSIAQSRLLARRGIQSLVVPNVFDFENGPNDAYEAGQGFRSALGLSDRELYILQPTRVIRRKGIELALELVRRLAVQDAHLIITHKASDEGLGYWHWLQHEARQLGVDLRLVDDLIGMGRSASDRKTVYSLWDAYPSADLVTFPSIQEGFGNALLEAVFFRKPVVINRYPVYHADIKPLGFQFVELAGFVNEAAVQETRALLEDRKRVERITEHNFNIARQYFSTSTLRSKIEELL